MSETQIHEIQISNKIPIKKEIKSICEIDHEMCRHVKIINSLFMREFYESIFGEKVRYNDIVIEEEWCSGNMFSSSHEVRIEGAEKVVSKYSEGGLCSHYKAIYRAKEGNVIAIRYIWHYDGTAYDGIPQRRETVAKLVFMNGKWYLVE